MLRLGLDQSETGLHTWSALPVALLLALCMVACVSREGRNSACTWAGEAEHPGQAATDWHLGADAEFAEELADRYMITHYGPQSGHFVSFDVASEAEGRCLTKLFDEVGQIHGVTGQQVAVALRHNLYWTDLSESLSFLLVYAFAASLATRRIWSRYPPANGWTEGILLLMFCSLAFATGAVAMGENWVIVAESMRIGAGHLGDRAQRSFFSHHRMQLFGISLVMFWLIAVPSGWRNRPACGTIANSEIDAL